MPALPLVVVPTIGILARIHPASSPLPPLVLLRSAVSDSTEALDVRLSLSVEPTKHFVKLENPERTVPGTSCSMPTFCPSSWTKPPPPKMGDTLRRLYL